jgi:hypothetical protein
MVHIIQLGTGDGTRGEENYQREITTFQKVEARERLVVIKRVPKINIWLNVCISREKRDVNGMGVPWYV